MTSETDFEFGHNVAEEETKVPDYFEGTGCMGSVKCTKCGKFHGYCSEVQKQGENMLPRADNMGEDTSSSKRKRTGGMNYLTNDMLTTQPQEAKILAVKYDADNKFGARVILKIAFQGKVLFKGLNIKKDPNYQIMTDKFGHDENDWAGQKILLYLEQDNFSENFFQRVSFPTEKKGGKN